MALTKQWTDPQGHVNTTAYFRIAAFTFNRVTSDMVIVFHIFKDSASADAYDADPQGAVQPYTQTAVVSLPKTDEAAAGSPLPKFATWMADDMDDTDKGFRATLYALAKLTDAFSGAQDA